MFGSPNDIFHLTNKLSMSICVRLSVAVPELLLPASTVDLPNGAPVTCLFTIMVSLRTTPLAWEPLVLAPL